MTKDRKLSYRKVLGGIFSAGILLLGSLAGGCGQDRNALWSDADPSTDWRLKRYYEGDSARTSTAKMNRESTMGFGIPGLGGGDK